MIDFMTMRRGQGPNSTDQSHKRIESSLWHGVKHSRVIPPIPTLRPHYKGSSECIDPRFPRSNCLVNPVYIGSTANMAEPKKVKITDVESQPSENEKPSVPKLILKGLVYALLIITFFYFFICSLDLMSSAFRLIGGKATGALANSWVLGNPIAGLMVGILLTVLVQSSSTSTSIIVTMVAARLLKTEQACFMLMGANIGTSVTNTLVAMGHVGSRKQFRLAFAGATVHDVFNWLTVLILLPLEVVSQYLNRMTLAIVDSMNLGQYKVKKQDLLKELTKGLTQYVVRLDSDLVEDPTKVQEAPTLLKWCCKIVKSNESASNYTTAADCQDRCDFMFANVALKWADWLIGLLLFLLSLAVLIVCLVGLVKTLSRLLEGRMSLAVKKLLNSDRLDPFTGYIAILVGAGVTILVQSSSVFTSAITPLVGTGFIKLERMYPLTLGSNIGTTVTGMLAALSADSDTLSQSMQTALIHLFFNISGILIWFPLPFMRAVPVSIAKQLGRTTSRYRWFAIAYILWFFFLMPLIVFGLSLVGMWLSLVFILLLIVPMLVVGIVTLIQKRRPNWLPEKFRNWKWLPLGLRSLEPVDRVVSRCACRCCTVKEDDDEEEEDTSRRRNGSLKGEDNPAMIHSCDQINGHVLNTQV